MEYKERNKTQRARRRFELRELIYHLKESNSCVDCGNNYHPCQVDIVRKDGTKSVQLSKVLHKSKQFLIEELQKCVFICSNCNRIRTWEYQRQIRKDVD